MACGGGGGGGRAILHRVKSSSISEASCTSRTSAWSDYCDTDPDMVRLLRCFEKLTCWTFMRNVNCDKHNLSKPWNLVRFAGISRKIEQHHSKTSTIPITQDITVSLQSIRIRCWKLITIIPHRTFRTEERTSHALCNSYVHFCKPS